jgi:hypothetical protein
MERDGESAPGAMGNGPLLMNLCYLVISTRARKKDTSILAILVISCILYKKITANKENAAMPAAGPL